MTDTEIIDRIRDLFRDAFINEDILEILAEEGVESGRARRLLNEEA